MPAVKFFRPFSEIILGIWHITENEEKLIHLLSESGNEGTIRPVAHAGQRLRHIAGRALLASVSSYIYGSNPHPIIIFETGLPGLAGHGGNVSISHCEGFATCAIAMNPAITTGTDIEIPSIKMLSLAPRFLNHTEIEQAAGNMETTAKFWCGKEALYKALAPGNAGMLPGESMGIRRRFAETGSWDIFTDTYMNAVLAVARNRTNC
ncbi:MAG: 4'-phosphopantetheinyl transferase superfamily protein [Bacteroidota bacterium]